VFLVQFFPQHIKAFAFLFSAAAGLCIFKEDCKRLLCEYDQYECITQMSSILHSAMMFIYVLYSYTCSEMLPSQMNKLSTPFFLPGTHLFTNKDFLLPFLPCHVVYFSLTLSLYLSLFHSHSLAICVTTCLMAFFICCDFSARN